MTIQLKMSLLTDQIEALLKDRTAITLKELHTIFCNRSARSLSRDLVKVGVITSYTHAGQYRIRTSTPRFNLKGLWFYQDIGFSKYGTLKVTVLQFVESSIHGTTHKELQEMLKINVHNTLKQLVEEKKITRKQMPNNLYVYLHRDKDKSTQQFELRLSMNSDSMTSISVPSQWETIEVLAELIRCHEITAVPAVIANRLKQRGLDIKKKAVENIFTYYQIKKKPI